MPDIAMCTNSVCPSANKCYRFRAEPNQYRQTYSSYTPDTRGKCDMFEEYLEPKKGKENETINRRND